jgi:hypothetical protein
MKDANITGSDDIITRRLHGLQSIVTSKLLCQPPGHDKGYYCPYTPDTVLMVRRRVQGKGTDSPKNDRDGVRTAWGGINPKFLAR